MAATILLVDDDERILTLVARVLGQRGYEVVSARSGEEALNLAASRSHRIDLLLTDVVLPGASGVSVALALQAATPGLRVLLASGCPDPRTAGVDLPSAQFLMKPYSLGELVNRVQSLLSVVSQGVS